jgi:hypothetical protein
MSSNLWLFTLVTILVRILERFQATSTASVLAGALAFLLVALITVKSISWSNQKNPHEFPFVRGIPFIGSWEFFTRRYDFVQRGLDRLGNVFRFKLVKVGLAYVVLDLRR